MRASAHGSAAGVLGVILAATVAAAVSARAEDAKSAALAKQLAAALDAAKLDSIAAKDPSAPDAFVSALYFPGQLLVIGARYSAPSLLSERLGKKEYREVYMDLNGAAVPNTKIFIEDPGADGLKADHNENQASDTIEIAGKHIAFDSDWKKQKLSKEEYLKAFSDADERYSQMLQALLAELKKPT
jgi:hypothetical protein